MGRKTASVSSLSAIAGLLLGCGAEKASEPRQGKPGLAAHWSMEDTSGGSVDDGSGNGHDGKIIGRLALAEGASGKALSLTGSGMGLDVPDHADFAFRGGFTLSLSFRIAAFPSGQGFLLFRGDSRMGMDPYGLSIQSSDSTLRFVLYGGPGGLTGDSVVSVSARVEAGRWYRADAVFDTTGENTAALYLDGKEVSRVNTSILPLTLLDAGSIPGIGIGHHAGRTFNDYPFNGLIDEVRIFSGPLSHGDIASGRY
jgi:hypothetical protein